MRHNGAHAPTDLVASSASPAESKWPRQQVLKISFLATVRERSSCERIINFRCEHIDMNTAMNKCQFERYRFTVFSVRNQMDLYRFVGFHSLRDLVNFVFVSCRVEAVQNGRQTKTG